MAMLTWVFLFVSVYSLLLFLSWNLLKSVLSWYKLESSSAVYASVVSLGVLSMVVVVPATLVTWITVLVLLNFCGKPRKSLVLEGKKLTAEITWFVIKVLIKEGNLVVAVCALLVAALAGAVPATWITVLVLLTFCGKPRKSLVVEGKKLTAMITGFVIKVLIGNLVAPVSALLGVSFGLLSMVVALAVATLVTSITVLVLLAFCGKPRKTLVVQGKKLTVEITGLDVKILIKEGNFVAPVCALIRWHRGGGIS